MIDLSYLISAICFIYGLKMLSHPKTARKGNIIASLGMLIAIIATVYLGTELDIKMIAIAMIIGSIIGSMFDDQGSRVKERVEVANVLCSGEI